MNDKDRKALAQLNTQIQSLIAKPAAKTVKPDVRKVQAPAKPAQQPRKGK